MKLTVTDQYAEVWLLLVGLIIVLHLYSRVNNKKRAMKFGNFETLQKVAEGSVLNSNNLLMLVRILAVSSLLVGLSSPQLVQEKTGANSDYVLAIDKSASMFNSDVDPTRFGAATEASKQLVSNSGNQTMIGVISFAGELSREIEPSSNKEAVKSAINSIEMGETAGTATGDAVTAAGSMLLSANHNRTVILFTDGKQNVGQRINESIEFAERHNVTVHAVGIAGNQSTGSESQIIDGNEAERIDLPNLNQTRLQNLAQDTGGKAIFASDSEAMAEEIMNLTERTVKTNISNPFFIAAGILLVLEAFVRTTNFDPIP